MPENERSICEKYEMRPDFCTILYGGSIQIHEIKECPTVTVIKQN
jgi:hypothetical protein